MPSINSERRIGILAFGSTGDVLPYVALALGLETEGYPVTFVTHARFEALARKHGLQTAAVEDDPQAALQTEAGLSWLDSGTNMLVFGRNLRRILDPLLQTFAVRTLLECRNASAIVGTGLAMFMAPHIAEKLRVPFFPSYLQPMSRTTEFRNPFIVNVVGTRGLWNLLSHFVYRFGSWELFRPTINRMRQESLGLPPLAWHQRFPELQFGKPVLYGYSPSVLAKPKNWPASFHVTGYWFPPSDSHWHPSPELIDFLDAGPPPVCVGFGSMTDRDPERMTTIALRSLARTRQRGILLTGWGALSGAALPDSVFKVESAPHEWLFPRVRAVVAHGGAGTTAAALRAGRPLVTVPFFGDQFFWGDIVHRFGAGARPIAKKQLTTEALTAAITQVVDNNAFTRRAHAISLAIQREDGVATASRVLRQQFERVLSQRKHVTT